MASRKNKSTVLDTSTVNVMLSKHVNMATPLVVQPMPFQELIARVCAFEQKVLRGQVRKTSIITYTSHTLHRVVGSTLVMVAVATDAKSIYDNVRKHQETYTNHDKRVSLELAVVRDGLRTIGSKCRWVPHFENPADCLTDLKSNVDRLLQLMREGTYGLVN
eukprot:1439767-Amphidinium_carterae.2